MSVKAVRGLVVAVAAVAVLALLGACEDSTSPYPVRDLQRGGDYANMDKNGSIFGPGGLFGSSDKKKGGGEGGGGIGVNVYLWRATLDTVAFMPLTSADPFGGVILTDWYSPPGNATERFKLSVFILDRQLRADGVRVTVFRQVRDAQGGWTDAPVQPKTASEMEDAILARARELRISAAKG